jgi:hypothetical protein
VDNRAAEAARQVLTSAASPALLAQADEQEALLRLSLGDTQSPTKLASNLPAARRGLLLAVAAIERGDHAAASLLGSVLHTARSQGFLNTVVTTAPQTRPACGQTRSSTS